MNDKPRDYTGYDPDQTDDCERVLVTLLSGIGPYRDSVYVVGGLAPRYIVPLDPERPPHGGTADVDLVVRMSILADTRGYRTLEQNLEGLGFSRVPKGTGGFFSWRWQVVTDKGLNIVLEFLTGDLEARRGEREQMPIKGGKLNAVNFPVLHLVYHFFDERQVKAELLGGKGIAQVVIRHANEVSFLCAKADAFADRGQEKDAHDIAYCLENMELAPALAKFRKALGTDFANIVRTQVSVIEARFCSDADTEGYLKDGPRKAALFELPDEVSGEDLEQRRQIRQREISYAAERLVVTLRA